jgi:phospholipase C
MPLKNLGSYILDGLRIGLASLALLQLSLGASWAYAQAQPPAAQTPPAQTRTPIKHVIVIIGENRSFDHVFATYQPPSGQKVWNLLSEGIVNADGSPGPQFSKAEQTRGL